MTIPAMSAPSTAENPIAVVTRLETITTSRQAARNTSGFFVRAACANSTGSSSRPPNSNPSATAPPSRSVPTSGPTPAVARRRHRAKREDDRHQRDVLEQQHAERGAADRRLSADQRQDDRGRGQRKRQSEPDRSGQSLADEMQPRADDHRASDELGGADSKDDLPHRPQAPKRQLEADREQQHDDPELGERLDALRIRDRQILSQG